MPLRPDGKPMMPNDFRELHDKIAAFEKLEWIDGGTRDPIERYMPDLVDRLPEKRTETFDQAFGRMKARAKRKVAAKDRPKRKSPRNR